VSVTTNAPQVAERLRRAQLAIVTELKGERQVLAQRIAAEMRRRAPKGARSTLANSVRVREAGEHETIIEPTAEYARWVEGGRKPGKGLPFFGTPAARGAMDWVKGLLTRASTAANPRYRRGAPGTGRFEVEELTLRVQYFLLSAAIKRRGIKPQRFVKATADAMRPQVNAALLAAVKRGAAQASGGLA
jgi:hypothetical protein